MFNFIFQVILQSILQETKIYDLIDFQYHGALPYSVIFRKGLLIDATTWNVSCNMHILGHLCFKTSHKIAFSGGFA